jgi:predicted nucleotidyltransferase
MASGVERRIDATLRDRLAAQDPAHCRVSLFGSAARGEDRQGSDFEQDYPTPRCLTRSCSS